MENCKTDNIEDKLLEVTGNGISCHYPTSIYIKV